VRKKRTTRPVEPPQPPEVKRFVRLEPLQLIGVPILAAVVVAGLFGGFDDTSARSDTRGTPLAMHVEFPSRVQYQQSNPLLIEVRNESQRAALSVAIEIDRSYLEGFQIDSFLPEPDAITPAAYVVEVGDIHPAEVRRVAIDLRAERIGTQQGQVHVALAGRRVAAIDLSTFVFP
jgi:hypothetical protein